MMSFIKKHKELILYIVFGVGTTLVNWVVYTILVSVFNAKITLSNLIAWILAIIFAFVTNKLFVFESKSWQPKIAFKEGASFLASRIFSGCIEVIGPTLLMMIGIKGDLFGIKGGVSKIIINIVVIVLNYVLSKLFVFREKK